MDQSYTICYITFSYAVQHISLFILSTAEMCFCLLQLYHLTHENDVKRQVDSSGITKFYLNERQRLKQPKNYIRLSGYEISKRLDAEDQSREQKKDPNVKLMK